MNTTIRIVKSQAQNAYFFLHTVCEDTKRQDIYVDSKSLYISKPKVS